MAPPRELYAPELWQQLHDNDPDNYPLTIDDYKIIKPLEIKTAFTAEFGIRVFTSSFGFPVNNRRSGKNFDKDNVQSLIDKGQEPAAFRDANNDFQSLTIAQLKSLKQEMIDDGLSIYQKKWSLEKQVEDATTIADLQAIKW